MRYFSHEECKINNAMRDMYRKEWSGLKHRRHGKRKSDFAGFGEAAFFFCMTYPQKRDANRYKEDQNMPIIHVSETGKQDTQKKRDFMEFAANSIRSHTNTLPKNIEVFSLTHMSREKMISIFRVCGRELCEAVLTRWIPFRLDGGGFFAR